MDSKKIIKEPNYFDAECGKCAANDFIGHKFVNYKIKSMFIECEGCGECFDYDIETHTWVSKQGFTINKKGELNGQQH